MGKTLLQILIDDNGNAEIISSLRIDGGSPQATQQPVQQTGTSGAPQSAADFFNQAPTPAPTPAMQAGVLNFDDHDSDLALKNVTDPAMRIIRERDLQNKQEAQSQELTPVLELDQAEGIFKTMQKMSSDKRGGI